MFKKFEDLYYKASSVFSPAAPVDKRSLFAGRKHQLSRVIDSINTKGQHAIVFGERGVGKTSLANMIHETLTYLGRDEVLVNKVNCDSTDRFSSIWRKALRRIAYIQEAPIAGFEPKTQQTVLDLSMGMDNKIVPDEICKAFSNTKTPIVFIFDEFDRMTDATAAKLFSDTMKSLSDNAIDGTLVLVGVADDVDDLIRGHESIQRSLAQIKVPRMNADELKEILSKASETLEVNIVEAASQQLLKFSQGLPHYTHLLGLEAVRSALRRDSMDVTKDDVREAVNAAVDTAQQSIISAYLKATSSSHKGHLYKEVLLACALARGDELGYFSATDVREPLSKIKNKEYATSAFFRHLHSFCSLDRGNLLLQIGPRRSFRYRFKNPLMPPFIIIRGYADGLLTEGILELVPPWSL